MSVDVLDQVRKLAPANEDLEKRWPAEARAETARRILANQVGGGHRLRHLAAPGWRRPPRTLRARLTTATLVVTAVAATLAVPTLLPHGTPGAAGTATAEALHHLAAVAADTPADSLGPGQYVHTVTRSHQVGVPENPELGPVVMNQRTESWTAYDGRAWTRTTSAGGAPRTLYAKANAEGGAAYFASLPTDPDGLNRYLRWHSHGSDSKDEAVFLAVGDLMADVTAPAALRSAAATVLAGTHHVRLGPRTTDALGRSVTELDFVDESIRPDQVQGFLVNISTAQVVGRRDTQRGSSYVATLESSHVVDTVPLAIVANACPESGRIC